MKVTCIQMDMAFGRPEDNFRKAEALIEAAMAEHPDVLVLPEMWNTGFFPKENLKALCDRDGYRVKTEIGALAKKFSVNIVAGSVADLRDGKVYNTAYVFDRNGQCVASYDKTHLFSPMGEDRYFTPGDRLCRFTLDGINCGLVICYDIRFPELSRSLAVEGIDVLFLVSQWPRQRISHLQTLSAARAIENQIFLVCCNSCGTAENTVFGGNSAIIDPLGNTLAQASEQEILLHAQLDFSILQNIRTSINVFADRRPELYRM